MGISLTSIASPEEEEQQQQRSIGLKKSEKMVQYFSLAQNFQKFKPERNYLKPGVFYFLYKKEKGLFHLAVIYELVVSFRVPIKI